MNCAWPRRWKRPIAALAAAGTLVLLGACTSSRVDYFLASPNPVAPGAQTLIYWKSEADSCKIDGILEVDAEGSLPLTVNAAAVHWIRCEGDFSDSYMILQINTL